tara:strand:+ start:122 stop:385 length:264 start_codon:yes stop_codon:yes gene_type:complete
MGSRDTFDEQIILAFRTVVSRQPTSSERVVLANMFTHQHSLITFESALTFLRKDTQPTEKSHNPMTLAALANVCLAILNLDEALTRE